MKPARTCSATARSIGRPSADSSAHSSSAVDSDRAVGTAIGRSASAPSAACCSSARARAASAHRASRSAPSDHPPLTHSGRRWPSGATGSSSSSSGPDIPNRSSGPPDGRASVASPRARAQAQPGSARHPPNSSRCAATMSQQVASRRPAATSCAAVWDDHTAHLGRRTWSARPTSAASPAASTPPGRGEAPSSGGTVQARAAVATPSPRAGETASPTRSPRATPARRNDVTRSSPAGGPGTDAPVTDPTLPRTGARSASSASGPGIATLAPAAMGVASNTSAFRVS